MVMSFMRSSRECMMRVLIEMLIRRRLEIRFGTMAEEGDSSVITSCSVLANDYIIYGKMET